MKFVSRPFILFFIGFPKEYGKAWRLAWTWRKKTYDVGHHPFYIEVFKSPVDKEVNIGQKAYDFPMISQVAFKESSRNLKNDLQN